MRTGLAGYFGRDPAHHAFRHRVGGRQHRQIDLQHGLEGLVPLAQRLQQGGMLGGKHIVFSLDRNSTNSWNESLNIDDDGHSLFLRPTGLMHSNQPLTQQGGAELFWSALIDTLQR